MPGANVETIRALLDAWNRGDWEEALSNTAPDFELDSSLPQASGGVSTGAWIAGLRE